MTRRGYAAHRHAPGRYAYRGHAIIRTDWEGERNGTRWVWEIGEFDAEGVPTLNGLWQYPTLRAAKAAIDAELGS